MLNVFRNPEWFWKALNEMAATDEFGEDLEIEFVGILSDDVLATFQDHTHLVPLIQKYNYLPHSQVLQRYKQSSVLLLLQNNSENGKGHLPGKFFEYLGADRRILCVGNKESDLAEILNRTKSRTVFEQTDADQLKSFLREAYQDWKNGSLNSNAEEISEFGRRSLTQKLSKLLNTLGTR